MSEERSDERVGLTDELDFTKFAAMAKRFRDRDELAVNDLNEHINVYGRTLEVRLAFAEARLHDTAGLLVTALELLGRMKSNDKAHRHE